MSFATASIKALGFVPMSSAMADGEFGRCAVHNALTLVSIAAQSAALIYTPWYLGVALSLLIAVLSVVVRLFMQFAVSDDSFAAVGSVLGGFARRAVRLVRKEA